MVFRDPAWTVFLDELRAHLDGRMTSAALAEKVGVDEETVRNWRKGRVHPRLGQLPLIAEVLQMGGDLSSGGADPLYLHRRMGLLPARPPDEDLIDAAYRLQKLEQKLAEAMDRAGSLGRREGASTVVRAAVKTGEWAVAVWPVTEGTADCPLHVADRIDIRRTDGLPVTTDDVWRDQTLKAALRAAYAVPATRNPRWSTEEGISHWAISHVGSPRSPLVRLPHPGAASVVCLALTVDSWVNDVASLIGTALGYGLTTTRDLAMEAYGLHYGATLAHHRQIAYEAKLERPPQSRVLSHHAPLGRPPCSPFLPASGRWREDVIFVWLRESDDLLRQWLTRATAEGTFEGLIEDRGRIDDYAAAVPNPDRVIALDVRQQASASAKWQQVLECVSTALTQMVDRGLLTTDLAAVQAKAEQDDPSIAVPLLRWLRKDGCAAVLEA
jgi:transcriptional regulator with XRE-family HTH domain